MKLITGKEVVSHLDLFRVFLNQNSTVSLLTDIILLLLMAVEWVYLPIYLTTSAGPENGGLEYTTQSFGAVWYSHCLNAKGFER